MHDFSVDEGVWDWFDEIFVPEGTHESVIVRSTDSIWDVRGINYFSIYVDVLPVPEPCTSAFFILGACLVSFRRAKI